MAACPAAARRGARAPGRMTERVDWLRDSTIPVAAVLSVACLAERGGVVGVVERQA